MKESQITFIFNMPIHNYHSHYNNLQWPSYDTHTQTSYVSQRDIRFNDVLECDTQSNNVC